MNSRLFVPLLVINVFLVCGAVSTSMAQTAVPAPPVVPPVVEKISERSSTDTVVPLDLNSPKPDSSSGDNQGDNANIEAALDNSDNLAEGMKEKYEKTRELLDFRSLDSELMNVGDLMSKVNKNISQIKSNRYEKQVGEMMGMTRPTIEGEGALVSSWDPLFYCWASPSFCHRPLYFEQPNMERYAKYPHLCTAVPASLLHFYGTALTLPGKMVCEPCWTDSCTLGHNRPGDCAPFQRHVSR